MSASDIHSILYRGSDPLKTPLKPTRRPETKTTRYWPGKVPDYALSDNESDSGSSDTAEEIDTVPNTELQDKRLRRIQELEQSGDTSEDDKDDRENSSKIDKRRKHVSIGSQDARPIYSTTARSPDVNEAGNDLRIVEEEECDDDDDAINERRERIRAVALQHRLQEEETLHMIEEENDEDDDEELDSEEDDPMNHTLVKPVFVPKGQRESEKERVLLEREEERKLEELERRNAERKKESQQMLYTEIRREDEELVTSRLAADAMVDSDVENMPDDRDDIAEADEYELWKARELKRLKRDRDEREARAKFMDEIERRRNMTEEERILDDRRIDDKAPKKPKKSRYLFLQKYYHKGAYFQDEAQKGDETLYLRDYAEPTVDDLVDKKTLPTVMRLRRGYWGKAGQTKYTHLMDQDTTDFTAPWYQNDRIRVKDMQKMAGIKNNFNI